MKKNTGKYRLVIFDLDGTLMDTSEGILASVKYTIEKTGTPNLSQEQMKTFIGPPIQKSFARVYGIDELQANQMAAVFRERYSTVDLLLASPYDGIYELLEGLSKRQIQSAVATYKREDYALRLLTEYHFGDYMGIMHGSDMEGRLSKSDIIRKCILEANVELGEVVMVGDTESDEKGAHDIGIDFIGVTYGFGYKTKEDIKSCDRNIACVDSPIQILEII